MRTVLVINTKGGCGKSTIATHLAAAFARSQAATTLADLDRQGSALKWLKLRPKDAAEISGVDWSKTFGKPPKRAMRLVMDAPAGLRGARLDEAIAMADAIVVPVLPSIFDELSTTRFLKRIDRIKAIRKGRTPTLLVANRYRRNGKAAKRLEDFIQRTERPLTARLTERAIYADLAVRGLTLFDLNTKAAMAVQEEWMSLIAAVDAASD